MQKELPKGFQFGDWVLITNRINTAGHLPVGSFFQIGNESYWNDNTECFFIFPKTGNGYRTSELMPATKNTKRFYGVSEKSHV